MLVAAALVLVGCGGGAVWLAANDKDNTSSELFPGSGADGEPKSDARADATPATPPAATTTEQQAPETQPQETQPEDTQPEGTTPSQDAAPPAATPTRKTHFKRERRKPNDDEPERRFVVPPAREFSGEGNAHLGTVTVKTTAVLRWSSKGRLEIRFGREAFPIVAPTKSGQLVLPPFRFEQVRVFAAGRWKITVSPQ